MYKYLKLFTLILSYYFIQYAHEFTYNLSHRGSVTISILDVGQGDAVLIRTPRGRKILIDSGPDNYTRSYFDYPICKVDLAILTHFHQDHFGGFNRIMTNCFVKGITFNDVSVAGSIPGNFTSNYSNKFNKIVGRLGIYEIDNVNFVSVKNSTGAGNDENEFSLITFVTYKNKTAVFAGDAPYSAVTESFNLAKSASDLGEIYLFMVPHHGAKDIKSTGLLAVMKPKVCPISVGENSYGHPSDYTLKNLDNIGCKVFRTDKSGSLEFELK